MTQTAKADRHDFMPTLLFDLDGTLIDSVYAFSAWARSLGTFRHGTIGLAHSPAKLA
jgi:phosphoglycolate phosphatase-like HAD superfamily hydrolase